MELLDKVIELSDKYALDQANPRKAINMLELACAIQEYLNFRRKLLMLRYHQFCKT